MVTDSDIQRIIDENEAGIGDLMEAYINAERYYFGAVERLDPGRGRPIYTTSAEGVSPDNAGMVSA